MFSGLITTVGLFGRALGFHDATIGMMGSVSQLVASLAYMLSPLVGTWLFYAGPVIDFFNGANTIVNKALLSRTAPENELGLYISGVLDYFIVTFFHDKL